MKLFFNTERWQWIKSCWTVENNKSRAISLLFNGFPQMTYFFGGEDAYKASIAKYGSEIWYAPHNLWREVCHMFFGFCLAIPFISWPIVNWIVPTIIFSLMAAKEFLLDLKEQPEGVTVKNFLDAFAWGIGAFIPIILLN